MHRPKKNSSNAREVLLSALAFTTGENHVRQKALSPKYRSIAVDVPNNNTEPDKVPTVSTIQHSPPLPACVGQTPGERPGRT